MTEIDDDATPALPDPEERARNLEGASGTPVALPGGGTWLLADGGLCNALDDLRDRMYDDMQLRGDVDMADVLPAAWSLLVANYDLSPAEGAALLSGADKDELAGAVVAALFGTSPGPRTYTAWAASALLANGLDPAAVPGPLRRDVLRHLVETRRAVPSSQFIDSAIAAPKLAAARARAARSAPPAPPIPPVPAGDAG